MGEPIGPSSTVSIRWVEMSTWFAPPVTVTVGSIACGSGKAQLTSGDGPGLAKAETKRGRNPPASSVVGSEGEAKDAGVSEPEGAGSLAAGLLGWSVALLESVTAGVVGSFVAVGEVVSDGELESLTELESETDALGSSSGAAELR